MSLNLRKFFGESHADRTTAKVDIQTGFLKRPKSVSSKPRVLLSAPHDLRERLAASTQIEFIPCGKAVSEILDSVHVSQMNGVLIDFRAGNGNEILSEFLNGTSAKYPDLPCYILGRTSDQAQISKYGWQFVGIGGDASIKEVEKKLQKELFLFPWMKREVLRKALGTLKTLPAEAGGHQRIVRELQNPQFDLEDVAGLIKHDPALTAQLLKIVNSTAFSRGKSVQNVDEAVSILGAVRLQALVASAWAFFLIDDNCCKGFHPKNEWTHAVTIADRVRTICEQEGIGAQESETAVTSALLHDLGKLLLAANMPKEYAMVLEAVERRFGPCRQVEDDLLGFNHAEVGGCLLALWGVPLSVAEAVMLHHASELPEGSLSLLIQKAHSGQPDNACRRDTGVVSK